MLDKDIIEELIDAFSNLPGIGKKTAQRLTFHILQKAKDDGLYLSSTLKNVIPNIKMCKKCRNLTQNDVCSICLDKARDITRMCVVENPADLLAIENNTNFKGIYFVLHGLLSPIDNIGPGELDLELLNKMIKDNNVKELILAMNYSVESDVTAHVISEMISQSDISVTRIAQGIPIGSDLNYIDSNTLATAFEKRTKY